MLERIIVYIDSFVIVLVSASLGACFVLMALRELKDRWKQF
jgi:hypothetical protein